MDTNTRSRKAAIALRRAMDTTTVREQLSQDEIDWAHILIDRLFEIHNRGREELYVS